jgi:hypothetical protein
MANRNSSFGEGQSGAKGAETGIIKPAVERPALSGGISTAKAPAAPVKPKVAEQDGRSVFDDGTVLDEREVAPSKGAFVKAGGRTSDSPSRVPRIITTPTHRNAFSNESLQKLTEHYQVLQAHSNTHLGDVGRVDSSMGSNQNPSINGQANPNYGKVSPRTLALQSSPEAMRAHDSATESLSNAGTNLALAKDAFAVRQSAKGNGHLKSAASALVSAHSSLNHRSVREITGAEVPIHKDELKSWQEHTNKLPSFNRQGKPFPNYTAGKLRIRTGTKESKEIVRGAKGTNLGDKARRAEGGTPKTPKWEREDTAAPTRGEKGTGAIDTTTTGYVSGTTGENDPRRKPDDSARINVTLPKTNLPKIGDTTKPAKKPMKPGDKAKGK